MNSALSHQPIRPRLFILPVILRGPWLWLLGCLAILGTLTAAPHLRVLNEGSSVRLAVQLEPGSGVHYVRGARNLAGLNPGFLLRVAEASATNTTPVDVPASLFEDGAAFFRIEAAPIRTAPLPDLAWIPAGSFWLGSDPSEYGRDDDEAPVSEVTLTRGFWIGRHEVTQGEYAELMGINPSYFVATNGFGADLSRPVEQVNWVDATNYCAVLTQRLRSTGALPAAGRVRLPTEAEWEYAARAGTRTAYSFGTGLTTNLANFDWKWEHDTGKGFIHHPNNPIPAQTLPVGSFPPNDFGLHDVHGNVWEWVTDWHALYPNLPLTDPTGPATGIYKVQRGGAWHIFAWHCRSANRSIKVLWWNRQSNVGFRIVVELPED